MGNGKVKVLYIAGPGRGGSTILGNILGEIKNFFFVGEINSIWKYYLIEDRLCACGEAARECRVWKAVLNEAFGGLDQINAYEMDLLREFRFPARYYPEALMIRAFEKRSQLRPYLNQQLDHLANLYRAVQSTTGCRVIVDSSKRPVYGHLLGLIPDIDLRVVHLVRDPRAVAYSWLRRKVQPSTDDEQVYMQQYSPITSAARWNKRNITVEMLLPRVTGHYLMLRYEDFVSKPQASIKRILDLVQDEPAQLPFVTEHTVQLATNHSVRGNPSRFTTGLVELRLDEEWKRKMKRMHKDIVITLTWPLLIRYGYLGRKHN